MDIGNEYLKVIKERFKRVKDLADKTISQLSEEDLHWKVNEASNTIATIVKHVSGNMISRWSLF